MHVPSNDENKPKCPNTEKALWENLGFPVDLSTHDVSGIN